MGLRKLKEGQHVLCVGTVLESMPRQVLVRFNGLNNKARCWVPKIAISKQSRLRRPKHRRYSSTSLIVAARKGLDNGFRRIGDMQKTYSKKEIKEAIRVATHKMELDLDQGCALVWTLNAERKKSRALNKQLVNLYTQKSPFLKSSQFIWKKRGQEKKGKKRFKKQKFIYKAGHLQGSLEIISQMRTNIRKKKKWCKHGHLCQRFICRGRKK